jgi:hypothetical protein
MVKFRIQFILAPILALVCLHIGGCAGGAARSAGYGYSKGALEYVVDKNVGDTHKVVLKALKGMNIKTADHQENADSAVGHVKTRGADNTQIEIYSRYLTDDKTTVSIRVGTGMLKKEESRAIQIMDEIKKNI